MIGEALRAEIESYAATMRRSNPLFTNARNGTMTADTVARYLASIHYLVSYTPICLARARDRATVLGDDRLAAHYQLKRGEEAGHDAWAERDFERVSMQARRPVAREAMPAIRALIEFLARTIDEDPALYLAYILFTEHLTVLLGPEWLALLEEHCGIQRTSMTVVGNHVELDKAHVEHALEEIDDLVGDPRKLPRMREALRTSAAFFDEFCAQVTRGENEDVCTSEESEKHVSAA
jgi:pyrroloquinoline quinone (PQQ) biosynthesis protein C